MKISSGLISDRKAQVLIAFIFIFTFLLISNDNNSSNNELGYPTEQNNNSVNINENTLGIDNGIDENTINTENTNAEFSTTTPLPAEVIPAPVPKTTTNKPTQSTSTNAVPPSADPKVYVVKDNLILSKSEFALQVGQGQYFNAVFESGKPFQGVWITPSLPYYLYLSCVGANGNTRYDLELRAISLPESGGGVYTLNTYEGYKQNITITWSASVD